MKKLLLAIAILVLSAGLASGAAPRWEGVNNPDVALVASTSGPFAEGGFDVAVKDGYIYVACSKPTQVKVFTILGQLISQETLPAGTHRLRIASKGIYILKTADSTRRVTI